MPLHLRSGRLQDAPKKKYTNAYYIYFEERSKGQTNLTPAVISFDSW
jgi:hypothetical protein